MNSVLSPPQDPSGLHSCPSVIYFIHSDVSDHVLDILIDWSESSFLNINIYALILVKTRLFSPL